MKKRLRLIELLLIIMLFIIMSAIIVSLAHQFAAQEPHQLKDKPYLEIENALKFYKLDNGFYPTNEQGLDALIHQPLKPPIPKHWRQYLNEIPANHPPYTQPSD
jgi:general secretion pathway protein G